MTIRWLKEVWGKWVLVVAKNTFTRKVQCYSVSKICFTTNKSGYWCENTLYCRVHLKLRQLRLTINPHAYKSWEETRGAGEKKERSSGLYSVRLDCGKLCLSMLVQFDLKCICIVCLTIDIIPSQLLCTGIFLPLCVYNKLVASSGMVRLM